MVMHYRPLLPEGPLHYFANLEDTFQIKLVCLQSGLSTWLSLTPLTPPPRPVITIVCLCYFFKRSKDQCRAGFVSADHLTQQQQVNSSIIMIQPVLL